jgi:hypothetical protein
MNENGKTNEVGFQELAAIHPLRSIYGGTQKTKLPLLNNQGYKHLKGEFGSLQIFSIGRMPSDRKLLSLDASLAIPTRVLCFEAFRRQRPGRSDRPPGRSDRPRRSDRPFWAVEPAWVAAPPRQVFGLGFVAQPSNPEVFW